MTLIWHDWFATRRDDVGDRRTRCSRRTSCFRRHALGSFETLALEVTTDPAMLVFLNGIEQPQGPPERELRPRADGAVHARRRPRRVHRDRRPRARPRADRLARRLDATGRLDELPLRPRPATTPAPRRCGRARTRARHFDWRDAVELCLDNPFHRSFFVRKLWSYFIPTPPDAETQAALEELYVDSGYSIRPVVEAILLHPDLYDRPAAGQAAGRLHRRPAARRASPSTRRARGRGSAERRPAALLPAERLGLERPRLARHLDAPRPLAPRLRGRSTDCTCRATATTTDRDAAGGARRGARVLGPPDAAARDAVAILLGVAGVAVNPLATGSSARNLRAYRQNALRHLIATSPDFQTC